MKGHLFLLDPPGIKSAINEGERRDIFLKILIPLHLFPDIQVLQLYFHAHKNKKASLILTKDSVYHLSLEINL